jgi:hypothetical protein
MNMKLIKLKWLYVASLIYMIVLPVVSYADGHNSTCDPTKGKICNPLDSTHTIPELIQKILEGALKVGIPLLALAIIYSGFLFVVARGKSEKLEKAKDSLLYTIIGGAILLGAWAIAKMIQSTVLDITS